MVAKPNETGNVATDFLNAVLERNHEKVWFHLSKDSKAAWIGVCSATRFSNDLTMASTFLQNPDTSQFKSCVDDLCEKLLRAWGEQRLRACDVTFIPYPTEAHAQAILRFKLTGMELHPEGHPDKEAQIRFVEEGSEWKVDILSTKVNGPWPGKHVT